MRIGITISRAYDDWDQIIDALTEVTEGISYHKITVIHGASQTDYFVAGIAYMLGMELEPHKADWQQFGKAAGPIRNSEMVKSGADVWLAFLTSRSVGAKGCAKLAEDAGITVKRYVQNEDR